MKKIEYALIYRNTYTGKLVESEYVSESKIISSARYAKEKGYEILGINKRKVEEHFISHSDMIKHGYFD